MKVFKFCVINSRFMREYYTMLQSVENCFEMLEVYKTFQGKMSATDNAYKKVPFALQKRKLRVL